MPPTTMTEKSASLTWTRKHLLGLQELSAAEITQILDQAAEFKRLAAAGETKLKALSGTVVANLFFEPSTRTRTSFSLAAKRLSADTVDFTAFGGYVSGNTPIQLTLTAVPEPAAGAVAIGVEVTAVLAAELTLPMTSLMV